MLARPVFLQLVHGEQRLARLHVLGVGVAASAQLDSLHWGELAAVAGSSSLGAVFVGLRRIATVAGHARDSPPRVHVFFPELARPVFCREMALKAFACLEDVDFFQQPVAFGFANVPLDAQLFLFRSRHRCRPDDSQTKTYGQETRHPECPK